MCASELYAFSAITPFFLRDGALPPEDLRILDAGCGTGGKAIRLAAANPGTRVLGVDFSAKAVEIASERARRAGVDNVTFQHRGLEDLSPGEGLYDYVFCDDVLDLLDSPENGLRHLGSLLTPCGVLRANVYNERFRQRHQRARRALQLLGFDGTAGDAVGAARSLYSSLRPSVRLRQETSRALASREFADHALVGDRAFTLDETLRMIEASGLSLLTWADAPRWDARRLFRRRARTSPEVRRVMEMNRFDRYRFVDAVDYYQRFYDFWCCPPETLRGKSAEPVFPVPRRGAVCRLHPALLQAGLLQEAARSRRRGRPLDLRSFLPFATGNRGQPPQVPDLVLLIGEGTWPYEKLLERWERLRPLRPSDGRRCTAAETERELAIGLDFLRYAGVLLVLERP